ncbi:MAG: sulfotransferase family protein, partial [Sphingomonadales bacterium]
MIADARKQLFSGNFRNAHAAAQKALKSDAGAIEAALVMAAIAIEHENAPGAASLCRIIRNAQGSSCWLDVLEARVSLLNQDQDTARRHAAAALEQGTDDPHIANQLGVLLSRTGLHERAVAPFQQAVAGVPGDPDMRYNLAVALQFAGDLAQAEKEFRALLDLAPDHAKGWLALVQLSDQPDPEFSQKLERLFEAASDADTRLAFGHALARLAEEREEWDLSLEWLDRAKASKRAEIMHDRAATERLAAAAITASSSPAEPAPSGDQRPIFIVGMPRSGTTLVERILSSHPKVKSLGELSEFAILLKRYLKTPGPMVLDDAL